MTAPMHARSLHAEITNLAKEAKEASKKLCLLTPAQKNSLLQKLQSEVRQSASQVERANQLDCQAARGKPSAFLDRLRLDKKRLQQSLLGINAIIQLKDPIGEVVAGYRTRHGLEVQKVRVPLGVVGFIFEARPNVTLDAAALCLKSGNALLLKGGKEAQRTNQVLVQSIQKCLAEAGLPKGAVALLPGGREGAKVLMRLRGLVDLLIPRGGKSLIDTVVRLSRVPVLETGVGNCHVYVDKKGDLDKAEAIVLNAKTQRPSVCNAAETLLVHREVAQAFLPRCLAKLQKRGVLIKGCPITRRLFKDAQKASSADYAAEFLALVLAVRVVESLDEAMAHIQKYHTQHTEAIVTEDLEAARRFAQEVDSACIMVNCSTRFSDGFELGLGAEVGISTQKLHARGPAGLEALTSTKYVVKGRGDIRYA